MVDLVGPRFLAFPRWLLLVVVGGQSRGEDDDLTQMVMFLDHVQSLNDLLVLTLLDNNDFVWMVLTGEKIMRFFKNIYQKVDTILKTCEN
jgi:hypothetical protein